VIGSHERIHLRLILQEVGLPDTELLKCDSDASRYLLLMANVETHLDSRLNPINDASIQCCEGEATKLIDFCSVLELQGKIPNMYGRAHIFARTHVN